MRTIFYTGVSNIGGSVAHQEAHARAAGFHIDQVVSDDRLSSSRVRLRDRPEGRRLFDMLGSGDTLVVRWVDRLGRNYADAAEAIEKFMKHGVLVRTIVNDMRFDATVDDPTQAAVRDALIGFMAGVAHAQAETAREARNAGIQYARSKGGDAGAYRGRKPTYSREALAKVGHLLGIGTSVGDVAKVTGLTPQTIYRLRDDPAGAERTLAKWGL